MPTNLVADRCLPCSFEESDLVSECLYLFWAGLDDVESLDSDGSVVISLVDGPERPLPDALLPHQDLFVVDLPVLVRASPSLGLRRLTLFAASGV